MARGDTLGLRSKGRAITETSSSPYIPRMTTLMVRSCLSRLVKGKMWWCLRQNEKRWKYRRWLPRSMVTRQNTNESAPQLAAHGLPGPAGATLAAAKSAPEVSRFTWSTLVASVLPAPSGSLQFCDGSKTYMILTIAPLTARRKSGRNRHCSHV